jgi:hypothetical protein
VKDGQKVPLNEVARRLHERAHELEEAEEG